MRFKHISRILGSEWFHVSSHPGIPAEGAAILWPCYSCGRRDEFKAVGRSTKAHNIFKVSVPTRSRQVTQSQSSGAEKSTPLQEKMAKVGKEHKVVSEQWAYHVDPLQSVPNQNPQVWDLVSWDLTNEFWTVCGGLRITEILMNMKKK